MRLIDADALIEKCGEWYTEEGSEVGFIGTLKQLLDKQPTVNLWIPCSERLPREEEIVLVDDGTDIFTAWYSDGKWDSTDSMYCPFTSILAWMPRPESYLKEGEV